MNMGGYHIIIKTVESTRLDSKRLRIDLGDEALDPYLSVTTSRRLTIFPMTRFLLPYWMKLTKHMNRCFRLRASASSAARSCFSLPLQDPVELSVIPV